MAEEEIMADSSCCHGGGGGGVKASSGAGGGRGEGSGLFVNGPLASLDPPPPIQACRELLWRGDGNPGTWQQAGDLLAPRSSCLSSPSLSLS